MSTRKEQRLESQINLTAFGIVLPTQCGLLPSGVLLVG